MGDLEDAIREHLELKRRRGADPAEVAREEHEALAPVTRSHPVLVASPAYVEEDAPHGADDRPDAHEFVVPSAVSSTRPPSPSTSTGQHATVEIRRAMPGPVPASPRLDAARPPAPRHDADATQEFRVERNGIWLADDD